MSDDFERAMDLAMDESLARAREALLPLADFEDANGHLPHERGEEREEASAIHQSA